MGPELEDKGRSESTVESLANKENGAVIREVENKHITCSNNHEVCTSEMDIPLVEQAVEGHGGEDGKVDIVDTDHSGHNKLVEEKCEETSESSSSFDSVSGFENSSALSDAEVVSEFHEDAALRIRKRKLTSHWRAFIQPLMWRCKWVELQAKKLKLLADKYDNELAENSQKERPQVENTVMDFGAKSFPFSRGSQNFQVLKRKKRRKIEDTVDKRIYMSRHNLFSYYENRKSIGDGAPLDDPQGRLESISYNDEIGLDNELLWLESREGGESVEQMLRKIGILQGQVHWLKTRLDKVMSDNAGKFSCADNTSLIVQCNAFMSSALSPASPPNNGERMAAGSSYIASQLVLKNGVGDVVLPESAVSSCGEVSHPSDIIGSTKKTPLGGVCHVEDDILIYSGGVEEEMNNVEEDETQPTQDARATKERQENSVPPALVEPDLPIEDQPAPKIRSISKLIAPKHKKRKGRRKSASGRRRQQRS